MPPTMSALVKLAGCRTPIIQAPIGGIATPELAAAVSNVGAIGSLALTWSSPREIARAIGAFRKLSDGPLNANFVLDFPVEDGLRAALEAGAQLISFFWGDAGRLHRLVLDAGAIPIAVVGDVGEARRAVGDGAAVIVAQGVEAGGHVRGEAPLAHLLPAVKEVASGTPVVAAGGIATADHARDVRRVGADGVWVGTRFVASVEANAHPDYQREIIAATASDTVLSQLFDGGWPSATMRTLRNSTVRAWEADDRPLPGSRKGEGEIVGYVGGHPIERYHSDAPNRRVEGIAEAMALYAGQGVGLIDRVAPARDIVMELERGWNAP
jgi:nitronate monooxygenase